MRRTILEDVGSELCFREPCVAYEYLERKQLDMSLEFMAEIRAGDIPIARHWHSETGK